MFAESLKPERRTRPTLPQSARINRSSILAPRPELSLPGNQGGFVFCTRGSIPRANCARPDKLRAYKCSIRQRRLIVCASVCFHPDASSTGIIISRISRTRLRTESISGECGIIPIHSLYTVQLYDYTEFISAGRKRRCRTIE